MIDLPSEPLDPYVGVYDSGTIGVIFPGGFPENFDQTLKPELESLREYGITSVLGGHHPGHLGIWVVRDFGFYPRSTIVEAIKRSIGI